MAVKSRTFNTVDLDDLSVAAEYVKRKALECGADVAGIGNIERWEGAPIQMDPRQIMPECKSVIGLLFRVARGSLRGVEEGTHFTNYSAMGYGGINNILMPATVINLAKDIEDQGHEAMPYGFHSRWGAVAIAGGGHTYPDHSRPARPGQATPDVNLQVRIAAFLCGLGEIGFSKMFLSPQFGPRNRIGLVLTDLELTPDPIYEGPKLCNRCMACVNACPGNCFPKDKTVKVKLAGHDVEWSEIDYDKCGLAFRGGEDAGEPQETPYHKPNPNSRPGWWSPFYRKPENVYLHGEAICGARGCMRACMISLEARGVLENSFKRKFRRRPEWRIDWSTEPEYAPGAEPLRKKADDDVIE